MNAKTLVADARKGITAVAGAAGEAIALGLLHGTAERWTTAAIALLAAAGVVAVPNGKKNAAGQRVLVNGKTKRS